MGIQDGRLLALEYLDRAKWVVIVRSRYPDRLMARAPGYTKRRKEVRISCGREIVARWVDGVRVGNRSGKPLDRPVFCSHCRVRRVQQAGLCRGCLRRVKAPPFVPLADRYHKGAVCVLRRQLVRKLVIAQVDGSVREFEVVYDGT